MAAEFPTAVPTFPFTTPAAGKGIPFDDYSKIHDEIVAIAQTFITGRAKCAVYHNTTQSLSDATPAALNFNSEEIDVGTMHDTATNNTRVTIPSNNAGHYLAIGQAGFAPSATGIRYAQIRKNGSTLIAMVTEPTNDSVSGTLIQVATFVSLAASDYLELIGFQNSGGALNAGHASNREQQNSFQVFRVW